MSAIEEWGAVMRLANRAAALACEEQRRLKRIKDPLDSAIMLYTDDPSTAGLFAREADMAAICRTSAIEGVCIVMGEKFPPAAFEAQRTDLELPRVAAMWFPPAAFEAQRPFPKLPRVAAMWFPAPGVKCPRCRNFTKPADAEVCGRCERQIDQIAKA